MSKVIRIKNASFYGYHGALTEEQSVGGKFEIDADLYFDFSKAAKSDNLNDTVDYKKIYNFISQLVVDNKYYLIETLAMKIADSLLTGFPIIDKVAVRVRKKNVPVGGVIDCVEAEVVKANEK